MTRSKGERLASRLPIVIIGVIASCIGIFAFCTGLNNVPQIISMFSAPNLSATSELIGTIKWEVKDNSTGTVLDKGNSNIFRKDIFVGKGVLQNGSTFYDENVPLDTNFSIALRVVPSNEKTNLDGFGMLLNHREMSTVSWEYFTIQDTRTANKLQGSGQLEYALGLINSKWEITRIRFLSDIVFRAHRADTPFDADNPTWLATVFAGSYIDLPLR